MNILDRSAEVWRGPSAFSQSGELVRVVLTGIAHRSVNEKTGPVTQAWVVRVDGNPSVDLGTNRELAICGSCRLRGSGHHDRICYVEKGAWFLGQHISGYPRVPLLYASTALRGEHLRIGAYADPAAVPYEVWPALLLNFGRWTGFTHAWRDCDQRYRGICMASVETMDDAVAAASLGWRYYRMRAPGAHVDPRTEIVCPYETRKLQCIDCGLCCGMGMRAKNVVITVHGPRAIREYMKRFAGR